MKSKTVKLILSVSLFLALVGLPGFALPGRAAPQADPGINKVYITNVRDGSFVVSWTTNQASDGRVEWGPTTSLGNTTSDSVSNTYTHYVQLFGLNISTTYYFQVRSGDGLKDNGGVPFQATTAPTIGTPTPGSVIQGYMYQSDGSTAVPNAIVYLQLQDADGLATLGASQWLSARTSSTGYWSYDLVNARIPGLTAFFAYTNGADKIQIIGQGGANGTKGVEPNTWTIFTPTAYPGSQNIILDSGPTAVTLVSASAAPAVRHAWLPAGGLLLAGLAASLWVLRKRRS